MPKNSRRKKKTRQHAAGKGERYVRAARDIDAAAQSTPAGVSARRVQEVITGGQATTLSLIQKIQIGVEGRGWVVPSFFEAHLDDQGLTLSTDMMWEYPPAFGGADLTSGGGTLLQKPLCSLVWSVPSRGLSQMSVRVDNAGTWGGCPQHRNVSHDLPWGAASAFRLIALLNQIQRSSPALDPAPYIACLAHGPCGELAEQWPDRRDPLAQLGPFPA